jgi:hypothetical protein
VQAGQETFNNELGAQIEPRHLADDFRSKIFLGGGHGSKVENWFLIHHKDTKNTKKKERNS